MSRRVVITGLGPISGLGLGMEPTWQAMLDGQTALQRIELFDPSGFDSQVGAQVSDFNLRDHVPKSYRKATKVMATDIEHAVAAADFAVRDAGLGTTGTEPDAAKSDDYEPTYPSNRVGCHIGAGLIAAELTELTSALAEAVEDGSFSIHRWGEEGIFHLTPLWLLKYLPNMLACHVTIIHNAQGPSNTITCSEASAMLSIGESLRVIQRDAADMCFCGGAEDKLNLMGLLRQHMTGRLNKQDNDNPATAVRPFSKDASGIAVGQGGAIVILESLDTFEQRKASDETARAYAELVGFGASQTVNHPKRNLAPDEQGRGIQLAIEAALRDAEVEPSEVDLIIPFGTAVPDYDQAEASALRKVFGETLANIPIASTKSYVGNCHAGAGGIDVCVAAKAIAEQTIPAIINCDEPLDGLNAGTAPSKSAELNHVLTYTAGFGGQNAAMVLKRLA